MPINLFNKIPVKKVGKFLGYAVTIGFAVFGAIADKKQEEEFEQLKKDVSMLKGKES